mmetsp:Transcript_2588/g.6416  ORF Transcript_2588/g.6416 Transcript_2588/m.6416 type:complete len:263 (+) Transcript_2588:3-791(+)
MAAAAAGVVAVLATCCVDWCEARIRVPLNGGVDIGSGGDVTLQWSGIRFLNIPRKASGPRWPLVFRADFSEVLYDADGAVENPGRWYYDFAHKRARFDHLKGQQNNFCAGQGLSDDVPDEPCHLIFSPDTAMYVHYPTRRTCCQLCKAGIGCSPLLPDWIADGRLVGHETIGGHSCAQYFKRGAVADDYWFETAEGMPCRYYEVLQFGPKTIYHNITFAPSTYSTDPIDNAVFDVPSYCNKMCPHPFPSRGIQQAQRTVSRS